MFPKNVAKTKVYNFVKSQLQIQRVNKSKVVIIIQDIHHGRSWEMGLAMTINFINNQWDCCFNVINN